MLRIDDIPQQVADDMQGFALITYTPNGVIFLHLIRQPLADTFSQGEGKGMPLRYPPLRGK